MSIEAITLIGDYVTGWVIVVAGSWVVVTFAKSWNWGRK